jgi:hypothetical protein
MFKQTVSAGSTPMYPNRLHLNRERTSLSVTWESGATPAFPATLLTRARYANSIRVAVNGWAVPAPSDLTITAYLPPASCVQSVTS